MHQSKTVKMNLRNATMCFFIFSSFLSILIINMTMDCYSNVAKVKYLERYTVRIGFLECISLLNIR